MKNKASWLLFAALMIMFNSCYDRYVSSDGNLSVETVSVNISDKGIITLRGHYSTGQPRPDIYDVGFYYKLNLDEVVGGGKLRCTGKSSDFEYTLSEESLEAGQTYYVYAYASDEFGYEVYGEKLTFRTKDRIKLSIAEFKQDETNTTDFYTLTGVVHEITDQGNGCLYLVDESGIIPVYGIASTNGGRNTTFTSLNIDMGDNITIRAQKRFKSKTICADNAYFVSKNEAFEEKYTYACEPTTRYTFSIEFTDAYIFAPQNSDNWYCLELYDDDYDYCIILWFICPNNSTTIIPNGTYYIGTYQVGNIARSPGLDINTGSPYNSLFYYNWQDSAFPKQELYFLTSGYAVVSRSGGEVTITVRATTYNGSSINGSWTGDLEDSYYAAPKRKIPTILESLNMPDHFSRK